MSTSKFERIIKLSTITPDGIPVYLDDERYETVAPVAWGAQQSLHARKHLRFIGKFEDRMTADTDEEPSEDDVREYQYHLRAFVKLLVPSLPQERIDALTDVQCQGIVKTFMAARDAIQNPAPNPETSSATNGTTPTSAMS